MFNEKKIPSHMMVRELPEGVKVVKTINGIDLYNMNTFQNIMSWNQHNLDVPAFDYFGHTVTYGELPETVELYAKGFSEIGIKEGSIVTISLPVMIEYFASLFALLNLGAISNNVNFLFLRNDLHRYTLDKNSETLIVLDAYLPMIATQLEGSNIKNIITVSLNDNLPIGNRAGFAMYEKLPKKLIEFFEDKDKLGEAVSTLHRLKDINILKMDDILKAGKRSKKAIIYPPVDIRKDSIYSYTSGTTGMPKCIVFNEQSPNAIIEMHNGLDLRDYVGDRSLVVIPPCHATGMFYAAYLQLAKGKTLVLQPIYSKENFATDLRDMNIEHTLAAASFYLEAVAQDNLKPGDLSKLARPCSGGEPISKSNVYLVNDWLKRAGCPEKVAIGGGTGEIGSSALTSYELDAENKTNETGKPIPGVFVKIVDPETGKEVKQGERGIIHISSAAASDRYLDNPKATSEYFYYDEKGIRWANLGDIAYQDENGVYCMLGRSSDSYIDQKGEIHYLFDIEYALSLDDPVIEWEITAFPVEHSKTEVVAQVVLKPEFVGEEDRIVRYLCEKYNLDGVKFYDSFETSEVTGKRNFQLLKTDYIGYYAPFHDDALLRKSYSASGDLIVNICSNESVRNTKKNS